MLQVAEMVKIPPIQLPEPNTFKNCTINSVSSWPRDATPGIWLTTVVLPSNPASSSSGSRNEKKLAITSDRTKLIMSVINLAGLGVARAGRPNSSYKHRCRFLRGSDSSTIRGRRAIALRLAENLNRSQKSGGDRQESLIEVAMHRNVSGENQGNEPIHPQSHLYITPDSFSETLDFACASRTQNQGFQKNCPECIQISPSTAFGLKLPRLTTVDEAKFTTHSAKHPQQQVGIRDTGTRGK